MTSVSHSFQGEDVNVTGYMHDIKDSDKNLAEEIFEKNVTSQSFKSMVKKIMTNKPDAEIKLDYELKQVRHQYEGSFRLYYDGNEVIYQRNNHDAYKNLADLINHAFEHIKRGVLEK